MFYVKLGKHVRVEINGENVVTDCNACGKEIDVELSEVLQDGRDLYHTSVKCSECTAKLRRQPCQK